MKASLALVLAGLLVYAPRLAGPFLFDDLGAIVDNPDIRTLWPLYRGGDSARPSLDARPLTRLSLALDHSLHGLDPRAFRATNLAWHLLCGLTLLALLRRAFARTTLAAHAQGLALAAALVWTLHPLHSQCVHYAIQRSEILAGLFAGLALYTFDRSLEGDRRWGALVVLCCLLGLLSKEGAAVLPLAVLLYDRCLAAGSWAGALRRRKRLYAALAACWLLPLLLLASAPHGTSIGFSAEVSPWDYALNQCAVLADYLRKSVWPHPLVIDYGFPRPLGPAQIWPQALLLAGLLALSALALYRRPALGLPAALFFLFLAPTSSFVPIVNEVGAERRLYLPLACLAALAAAAGWHLARRAGGPRTGLALLLGTAVILGLGTFRRGADFASALALWQSAVAAVPDNPRAHTYLGLALAAEGRAEEAEQHYRRALDLRPGYADAHANLGIALQHRGRRAEAMDHFREAVRLQPAYPEAHNNLGNALLEEGRPAEAVEHYHRALGLRPHFADAHNNLGIALAALGRVREAIPHFEQALRLRPDFAAARRNLEGARRSLP